MIWYFSGTGNSRWAAEKFAAALGEEARDIAPFLREGKEVPRSEVLGLVFPIHAWNVPVLMRRFLEKADDAATYRFAVGTCGGEAGHALRKLQEQREIHAVFSLVMPNNYILMGDVDSGEVQQKKLREAQEKIRHIARSVRARETVYDVHEGNMAAFKTRCIAPQFEKHAMTDQGYRVTESCNGCGLCESVCPTGNIRLSGGRPQWQGSCVQCLACLHHCPRQAIQYGKKTEKKGRYRLSQETI